MNIVHSTDSEVRKGIVQRDDKQELWNVAKEVTNKSLYSAYVYSIDGGVRVLVLDGSGAAAIDENCWLPKSHDLPIEVARKREFIRVLKERMRKLIKDIPKGAA